MHPYIHTSIHPSTHTYIHAYIHAHIHAYIHAYMHTYIQTYIHTTQLVHTQLTHTYSSTHNLLHANPSPSLPFSFPLSPCHLYLSFAACWKKLTCGVIRSFNFFQLRSNQSIRKPNKNWTVQGRRQKSNNKADSKFIELLCLPFPYFSCQTQLVLWQRGLWTGVSKDATIKRWTRSWNSLYRSRTPVLIVHFFFGLG